jgi:hypothetical protein
MAVNFAGLPDLPKPMREASFHRVALRDPAK